jgi:predicted membrane metal-binding protein
MMTLMVLVEAWPQVMAALSIPPTWSVTCRAVAATAALALSIKSCVRFMRSRH